MTTPREICSRLMGILGSTRLQLCDADDPIIAQNIREADALAADLWRELRRAEERNVDALRAFDHEQEPGRNATDEEAA